MRHFLQNIMVTTNYLIVPRRKIKILSRMYLRVIKKCPFIMLSVAILFLILPLSDHPEQTSTSPSFLSQGTVSLSSLFPASAMPTITLDPPRCPVRRCPEDLTLPLTSAQHQFCPLESLSFDLTHGSFLLNDQNFEEICQTSYLLSQEDTRLYEQIFTLQEQGDWLQVDRQIEHLEDRRLLGHILFQRYMHPTLYRSEYEELSVWLEEYADHPGADRIYRLARQRQPVDAQALTFPEHVPSLPAGQEWRALVSGIDLQRLDGYTPDWRTPSYPSLERTIDQSLSQEDIEATLELLNSDVVRTTLSDVEYDALRSNIAAYSYYKGGLNTALLLARASAERSGTWLPKAYWISGLVSWRLGMISDAHYFFSTMATETRSLTPWQFAAASFWAGRAALRLNNEEEAQSWFQRAARFQRTFYGFIARYLVDREDAFYWQIPRLTSTHISRLAEIPAGRRAMALLQIGELSLAEAELLRIHPQNDPILIDALLVLSIQGRLPTLALQLGNAFPNHLGTPYDAALYPIPSWVPHDGYQISHALIYALIRQESRFNTQAISPNGAIGLMQLMPPTASSMSQQNHNFDGQNHVQLFDPQLNITLGQRYISYLLDHPAIDGNLFMLIAAYNGGPGNLRRWQQHLSDIRDDPLLFLESIPYDETRTFITKVFENYWIYRLQFRQQRHSLHALANGHWPSYRSAPIDYPVLIHE